MAGEVEMGRQQSCVVSARKAASWRVAGVVHPASWLLGTLSLLSLPSDLFGRPMHCSTARCQLPHHPQHFPTPARRSLQRLRASSMSYRSARTQLGPQEGMVAEPPASPLQEAAAAAATAPFPAVPDVRTDRRALEQDTSWLPSALQPAGMVVVRMLRGGR